MDRRLLPHAACLSIRSRNRKSLLHSPSYMLPLYSPVYQTTFCLPPSIFRYFSCPHGPHPLRHFTVRARCNLPSAFHTSESSNSHNSLLSPCDFPLDHSQFPAAPKTDRD